MGARGEYDKSKRNGAAVMERNGRAAKGKEENETEQGVRSGHFFGPLRDIAEACVGFRAGCFGSSRVFLKMIGEGCDVGGRLWSC